MSPKRALANLSIISLGFIFAVVVVAFADFQLNPPPPKAPPDYSSWAQCHYEKFTIRFTKEINGENKYFGNMEVGRILLCRNPKNPKEQINKYYILGQDPKGEPAFLGWQRGESSRFPDAFFIKYQYKNDFRWVSAYDVNVIGESVIFNEKGKVKQFTANFLINGTKVIYRKTFVVDWSPKIIYKWFKRTAFLFDNNKAIIYIWKKKAVLC